MAMIKCPECGSEASDQAPACPKCGYPIAEKLAKETSAAAEEVVDEVELEEVQPEAISEEPAEDKSAESKSDMGGEAPDDSNKDKDNGRPSMKEAADSFAGKTSSSSGEKSEEEKRVETEKKKKTIAIAAIIGGIVLLLIIIFAVISCTSVPPAEKVKEITGSYKSSTSSEIKDAKGGYVDLAGVTPQDSSFIATITYEDGHTETIKGGENTTSSASSSSKSSSSKNSSSKSSSSSSSSSKADKYTLEVKSTAGPVPLEDGKDTTYQLAYGGKTCDVTITGVEVKSFTCRYTGSTVEGTQPKADSFKIDVTYTKGAPVEARPTSVEGGPLVANQATTYTLTYEGVTETIEVTGTPKPEPKPETTVNSNSGTSAPSGQGADYKAKCTSVTYNDLVSSESKWRGKDVKFKGQVLRSAGSEYSIKAGSMSSDAYFVGLTQSSGHWEDPVYMDVITANVSKTLTPGNVYTFYGEYDGIISGSGVGVSGRIPSLIVSYVD